MYSFFEIFLQKGGNVYTTDTQDNVAVTLDQTPLHTVASVDKMASQYSSLGHPKSQTSRKYSSLLLEKQKSVASKVTIVSHTKSSGKM